MSHIIKNAPRKNFSPRISLWVRTFSCINHPAHLKFKANIYVLCRNNYIGMHFNHGAYTGLHKIIPIHYYRWIEFLLSQICYCCFNKIHMLKSIICVENSMRTINSFLVKRLLERDCQLCYGGKYFYREKIHLWDFWHIYAFWSIGDLSVLFL